VVIRDQGQGGGNVEALRGAERDSSPDELFEALHPRHRKRGHAPEGQAHQHDAAARGTVGEESPEGAADAVGPEEGAADQAQLQIREPEVLTEQGKQRGKCNAVCVGDRGYKEEYRDDQPRMVA
jgi:hypothetical protein